MIIGVGFDLCGIARMETQLKGGRFLARFFSLEEQAYISARGQGAAASAAACFAAKEAFVKALGTGFDGIPPQDIAVIHDEKGRPGYDLRGLAKVRAESLGVAHIHLSLSHEEGMAGAFCVLEGESK